MGQITPETHGCETIRLTIEDDLRTQEGLETALRAINAPNVLLWAAIPCTGGCAWNALSAKRGSEATREKIRGHRVDFWTIWHNFEKVAEATIAKGGYVAIEWPSSCAYWRESRIQEFVNKHACERAYIHGCMYGLKSIAPGKPHMHILKPWTVMTTCPGLAESLSITCNGKHVHTPCAGVDTKGTEEYTPEMVKRVHIGFGQAVAAGRGPCSSRQPPARSTVPVVGSRAQTTTTSTPLPKRKMATLAVAAVIVGDEEDDVWGQRGAVGAAVKRGGAHGIAQSPHGRTLRQRWAEQLYELFRALVGIVEPTLAGTLGATRTTPQQTAYCVRLCDTHGVTTEPSPEDMLKYALEENPVATALSNCCRR